DRELFVRVDELDAHTARLRGAPAPEQLEDDVLAVDPRRERALEDDAALLREREEDRSGRPAEAERGAADAHADRAVGAVGATVRVRAGDEPPRHDEALLGEVEVEDARA